VSDLTEHEVIEEAKTMMRARLAPYLIMRFLQEAASVLATERTSPESWTASRT
jgi:hypothetical protein